MPIREDSMPVSLPATASDDASAATAEDGRTQSRDYEMRLSLNVLNHLGIYLYSNTAAVLSEVVANAWDADADEVDIRIDGTGKTVKIRDDGRGMTLEDINRRFLLVGYQKRQDEPGLTPKERAPMGRKGIGKLSLFSIAREVLVETARKGEKHAFRMTLEGIEKAIGNEGGERIYRPLPTSTEGIDFAQGTRITLSRLKKELHRTPDALRRRLARRFAILGAKSGFEIVLDGKPISIVDRDYFHKIQFVWTYDDPDVGALCSGIATYEKGNPPIKVPAIMARPAHVSAADRSIRGWIGTVAEAGQLKDPDGESLNKIVVMVRGKMAHEDILEEFGEGGLYTKYLIGELHADFLDEDDQDDIATSSRQSIMEDAPRFAALKTFVREELRHIEGRWTELRNQKGTTEALKIPAIDKWYRGLGPDTRKRARNLFGKISQMPIDESARRRLLKFGVLAFENLQLKQKLHELDRIALDNVHQVVGLLTELSDIEATFYHQIITQRVEVIRKLQAAVDDDAKEKVLQEHIFNHLWLLDPSWERATNDAFMESRVESVFGTVGGVQLTDAERTGRLDIKYKQVAGKHVIVELKRSGRVVSTPELYTQVQKYNSAIRKVLSAQNRTGEPFEFLCIVGPALSDWDSDSAREQSAQALKAVGARVMRYDELLANAYRAYNEFLARSEDAGRLMTLIRDIDPDELS